MCNKRELITKIPYCSLIEYLAEPNETFSHDSNTLRLVGTAGSLSKALAQCRDDGQTEDTAQPPPAGFLRVLEVSSREHTTCISQATINLIQDSVPFKPERRPLMQKVGEQAMITIPSAFSIERDDEKVIALQMLHYTITVPYSRR